MDFYELDAFITLAETLNFSKAADLCAMSPSALSRMMSRFEEEVGAPLFDRDNRKVFLTERGKKIFGFRARCGRKKAGIVLP